MNNFKFLKHLKTLQLILDVQRSRYLRYSRNSNVRPTCSNLPASVYVNIRYST